MALRAIDPIHPESPSSFLSRRLLSELDMEQIEIAAKIKKSTGYVSMLMNGSRRISNVVAEDLHQQIPELNFEEYKNVVRTYDAWSQSAEGKRQLIEQKAISTKPGKGNSTNTLTDAQIETMLETEYLKVSPLEDEQIQSTSIDLTRGERFRIFRSNPEDSVPVKMMRSEEPIILKPFQSVTVWTKEKVELPDLLFGRIGPHSEIVREAIMFCAGPIIDPGYSDHIFATLFNGTQDEHEICLGDKIITLEISMLSVRPKTIYPGKYGE